MRYTPNPKQYEPIYIADMECYCRAKFGYANEIPDDDIVPLYKVMLH